MQASDKHRPLIPCWFFFIIIIWWKWLKKGFQDLHFLNFCLSLSPPISPCQQKIPDSQRAAARSQNLDLTLHLFSCPLLTPFIHLNSNTILVSVVLVQAQTYMKGQWQHYEDLAQNRLTLFCLHRTVYSVKYRQLSRAAPPSHYYPECCPGWRRFHSHSCNQGNIKRRRDISFLWNMNVIILVIWDGSLGMFA